MPILCTGCSRGCDEPRQTPQAETPVDAITSTCPNHFIVILGGPGTYDTRDPSHDQSWGHFFILLQVGFNQGLITRASSECIDWLVYGPAYTSRWEDDRNSNRQSQINDGHRYPRGYLHRIEEWIRQQSGHHFYNISSASGILSATRSVPNNSVTRLYFAGHASINELWMNLSHNTTGVAIRDVYVRSSDLASALSGKVRTGSGAISKLYGCNTSESAQTIAASGLVVEGSQNAIHFGYIDTRDIGMGDGDVAGNHLQRLETGPIRGISPGWTRYGN